MDQVFSDPDGAEPPLGRVASPRLSNPEQAKDLVMEVEEAHP
jgi:hypothetical protein